MGQELKFADSELSSSAITVAWVTHEDATMDCLNGIATGTTESTRTGRVVFIHSIHIKGRVSTSSEESQAAPAESNQVRLCLVWDKQTNATQLTATDVMDAGQTSDVLAFRNLQHTHRFRVLWDKTYVLTPQVWSEGAINAFAASTTTRTININKVFSQPIKVQFTGTGATVADIADNSFHLIGVTSSANANTPVLSYQVRIRFKG